MNPADLQATRQATLHGRTSPLEQAMRRVAIALCPDKIPVGLMLGQDARNDHSVLQLALKAEAALNAQVS